jgi:dinuclear metal center YbgI/SA1388 family protein
MVKLTELTDFLDTELSIHGVPGDKSNNGLQVEGKAEVRKVIGGVDGSLELYRQASEKSGDFIFVHHGESWGDSLRYLTGRIARRLTILFRNEISLYAAHLPLDAHPNLGNNARIATCLGIGNAAPFAEYAGVNVGVHGELNCPMGAGELAAAVRSALAADTQVFDFAGKPIRKIGIISGAGASALTECHALGLDCLITGECGHTEYHVIKELADVALITAGHYKTEVPGVVAVLDLLADRFAIPCEFIDIPTEM